MGKKKETHHFIRLSLCEKRHGTNMCGCSSSKEAVIYLRGWLSEEVEKSVWKFCRGLSSEGKRESDVILFGNVSFWSDGRGSIDYNQHLRYLE